MLFCRSHQNAFSAQGKAGTSFMLLAFSALAACVPYPHSVTRNPVIEGYVLSAETGQPVSGAKVMLEISSDESWDYEALSDTDGRFAFVEHLDYRLFALLADGPRCWTRLSVSAPGYHTLSCGWTRPYWCSSEPITLPSLMLEPEHFDISKADPLEDSWCLKPAREQAN